jgi:hypothetical protein
MHINQPNHVSTQHTIQVVGQHSRWYQISTFPITMASKFPKLSQSIANIPNYTLLKHLQILLNTRSLPALSSHQRARSKTLLEMQNVNTTCRLASSKCSRKAPIVYK